MAAGFEVTPAQLRAMQSFVSGQAADLREALAPVTAEVDDLLGSGWSGSAASAFAAAWREWQEGTGELLDGLGRMAALLGVSATGYEGSDQVTSSVFARLEGRA